MTTVLYAIQHAFMAKTFEAIDDHIDAESAYVPMNVGARNASETIPEVSVDEVGAIDRQVRRIDPDVVVYNHRHKANDAEFHEEYPLVHVRHGASIGRGEIEETAEMTGEAVDAALAPGEYWASRYEEVYPDDVDVSVVGVPEADALVATDPPRERRVLYAPTNHNYGGGSYLNTAREVVDLFAGSDYELLFRPHPADRDEEPGKSLTEACRDRIGEIPNVTFDANETPLSSMLASDILLSDYSGIVTEWLHSGRPLVQFTDIVSEENEVPRIGHVTSVDDLELRTIDALYEDGYPDRIRRREAAFRSDLGVPMDGRASERAAAEVMSCAE
ncbi:CDP-glycerol glycerophosphotransferase family protein [Halopiger thermotolerans]